MKGMPLPFDLEGKGVLYELLSGGNNNNNNKYFNNNNNTNSFAVSSDPFFVKWSCEPTSVLDNITSPNPPTSASTTTLSSSCIGGAAAAGSTDTEVAAVSGNNKWPPGQQHNNEASSSVVNVNVTGLEISGGADTGAAAAADEKCGMGMEEWESVLSDSVTASPSQEQSILRWIMGDVEDPSLGLNKMLQIGGVGTEFEFNGGFGLVDQHALDLQTLAASSGGGGAAANLNQLPHSNSSLLSTFPHKLPPNQPYNKFSNSQTPPMFSPLANNLAQALPSFEGLEMKPQVVFTPQMLLNQHQVQHTQNPAFFLPVSYSQEQQQQQQVFMPHQASKRHNSGITDPGSPIPKGAFLDSGQELFQGVPQRSGMISRPKIIGDDLAQQQQQQGIIDQLYKVAELVQSGNQILAQGILARLNHQLSPIGKPFQRAAFYCKEALQLLLQTSNLTTNATSTNSPFTLIFKIGAYKSFSEISPFLQFANFTCNQALLEVLDGFDRIHIIDFDIGYGGQWASFMQELALKSGGAPSLKITAFASPSTHDQLELGLTRENLNHFATEINMAFEFEIVSLDALNSTSWSLPLHVLESEAVAVNLPIGSFFSSQVSLPLVLRFIKQLSPKIVVSVDRGCDRTDLPFPNHVIHALQSYSNLLESLDASNVNSDALQKIERFLLQPGIEKIITGRYRSLGKTQHWRTLFLSSGFSPLNFSNFTESQAECVVKRTPVRGFHVEKRQSSLVLCWQRRELISASAWRC